MRRYAACTARIRRDAIANGAEAGLPPLPEIPGEEDDFEDEEGQSATARRPASIVRRSPTRLLAFAAWLVLAAPAAAGEAETFIRETADRVFAAYSVPLTDEDRAEVFRDVSLQHLRTQNHCEVHPRPLLARGFGDPAQEYLRLFEDFLVLAYANRFRDLGGVKLRVTGVREINKRDSLVQSEIGADGTRPPIRIGWRVRQTGNASGSST